MIVPTFQPNITKEEVHNILLDFLEQNSLEFAEEDFNRPWGGYFRISNENLNHFIDLFFPEQQELKNSEHKLQPKLLIVAPNKRLSWQYHHRRAELWKVLTGPIKVMLNDTDTQIDPKVYQVGELVEVGLGQRHRLIGADNWGLVAEIWKHTDSTNPSQEDDIVRVQDDFGR